MEFVFDKAKWSHDPSTADGEAAQVHPDWGGLRARLFAAREARGALTGERSDPGDRFSGSFDRMTADLLGMLPALEPSVNPNASANRKPGCGKTNLVATTGNTGDRDGI